MRSKVFYIVLTVSPSDLRRQATHDHWVPCTLEKGVLFIAGSRANGCDTAVLFEHRQDALNAIRRTKTYKKKHKLEILWGGNRILPLKKFKP